MPKEKKPMTKVEYEEKVADAQRKIEKILKKSNLSMIVEVHEQNGQKIAGVQLVPIELLPSIKEAQNLISGKGDPIGKPEEIKTETK